MYQYTCTRMHVFFHRILVYKHYRHYIIPKTGADPGFQVRGGALKKIVPSGGRRENFWGISCEKSRFYEKKNHIFSNFRGGARRVLPPPPTPPPGSAPAKYSRTSLAPTRMARIPWIAQTVSVFLDLPFPHRMINMRTTDLIGKT